MASALHAAPNLLDIVSLPSDVAGRMATGRSGCAEV
jgi:hypothetical protein